MTPEAGHSGGPRPRQREAIESWNRGDVCVVAGPGSGKTYVLVERFKWLIQVKNVPPRCILAITFTEKAAASMRRRLVESFPAGSELRTAVERAYISTIHAFCARLLKENAIEAKIDPEFRVLDEFEADFELRRAIEEALESAYAAAPDRARAFLGRFASRDVHGSLFQLYQAIRAAGVPVPEAVRLHENFDPAGAHRRLSDTLAEVASLPTGGWSPSQRAALREVLSQAPEQLEIRLTSLKAGSRQRDLLKRVKDELLPAWRAARILEENLPHRQWFLDVLAESDRLYRAGKQAAGTMDFADLEEGAIRLLEREGSRIRSGFSFILMDEFQDTNPLQARLVGLLRSRGNFFAVGDINQSIYGFRHADPSVFRRFREETADSGGHVVELVENFRSRQEILDPIKRIVAGAKGIEAQDLQAARDFPPAAGPAVEVFAVRADDAEEAIKLEAAHVASRIHALAASGEFGYGNIAVLLRTSNNVRLFEHVLRGCGVPCEVTEGRGYYDAREVNDLLCFLRALWNPLDEISLAAALRSPLGGATDEDLLRLKLAAGALIEALKSSTDPKLRRFLTLFHRYRRDLHHVPLDRLLGRLLGETGYESWLAGQPGATHKIANVRKLLALARRFHAGGVLDLGDFLDRIDELRDSEVREAEAEPPEQTPDAVQLMTIHAAKGLEFPVVFLPAINRGTRSGSPAAAFSPRCGVGMHWYENQPDAVARAISAEAAEVRRDESNRLFYVAMTRSEHRLVLSASFAGQLRISHWASLVQKNLPFEFTPTAAAPAAVDAVTVEAEPVVPPPLVPGQPGEQSDTAVSATSVALFARCPRRYFLSRYLGFEGRAQSPEENTTDPGEMDASEFGRLVHGLLAGIVPRDGASAEALELAGNFEASPLGARAAAAGRVAREQGFLLSLNGRLVSGQIDLCFQQDGETVVVDYKTDSVTAAETPARAAGYALQLRLYALALERLWGSLPDRAILYFLRPNLPVEVPLDAASLDAARDAVEALFRAQSRVDFPLRVGDHCVRCPYFHGLCPARYN